MNKPILTERQVVKIVGLIQRGRSYASIAKQLGVCGNAVGKVGRGERWHHLTGIPRQPKSEPGWQSGENSPVTRLKNADVMEIVKHLRDGTSRRQLADRFNVCVGAIDEIASGRRWSSVTGISIAFERPIDKRKPKPKCRPRCQHCGALLRSPRRYSRP